MNDSVETELITHIQNEKSELFTELLLPYKNKLYGYLLKMCGSYDDADDLLQETLCKAWKKLDSYDKNKSFPTWLFAIAHNIAIDYFRKRQYRQSVLEIMIESFSLISTTPENEVEHKELSAFMDARINTLPPKQKTVFMLHRFGEFTYKEIAEITGEKLNTVLSHMHYATKKLTKALEDYYNA